MRRIESRIWDKRDPPGRDSRLDPIFSRHRLIWELWIILNVASVKLTNRFIVDLATNFRLSD